MSRMPLALAASVVLLIVCRAWPQTPAPAPRAMPPATDPAEILKAARDKAIDQVLASSRGDDPFLRANALEAAQSLPDRAGPLVGLGLEDKSPAVRFTALVTLGKLQLKDQAPSAGLLVKDPSESVQAAALFALRRCGYKADLSPLARMLASPDPGLRGNAALLLGLLGDKGAVPMIKDMAKAPMPRASAVQEALVRLQIAEAIVRLGDDSVIDALRAAAYSQFDEVRVLAVTMLGDLGDRRWERAFLEMLKQPPVELQVAAAASLARFGKSEGLAATLKAAEANVPTQRAQAAVALGLFREPSAAQMLVRLLGDPAEQVRLSAAAAILRAAR